MKQANLCTMSDDEIRQFYLDVEAEAEYATQVNFNDQFIGDYTPDMAMMCGHDNAITYTERNTREYYEAVIGSVQCGCIVAESDAVRNWFWNNYGI